MREYTRKNRDKINAQRRARRTPETLEREKAWKKKNPGKIKEYKRTDREKRPEDYARWKREWRERNKDKLTERRRREYAEKKDESNARLALFRKEPPNRYRKKQLEGFECPAGVQHLLRERANVLFFVVDGNNHTDSWRIGHHVMLVFRMLLNKAEITRDQAC